MDPSHDPRWHKHETWVESNQECIERFKTWSGYKALRTILEPLSNLSLEENAWVADSTKCPVDNSLRAVSDGEIPGSFEHCRHYLQCEIEEINPVVIVTLGADSGERVLAEYFDIYISLNTGSSDRGRTFGQLGPRNYFLHTSFTVG